MEGIADREGGEDQPHPLGDEQHHRHIDGKRQKAGREHGAAGLDPAPDRQIAGQQQGQQGGREKKPQRSPQGEEDHVEDQLQQAGDRSGAQGAHLQFSPTRVAKGLLTTIAEFTASS